MFEHVAFPENVGRVIGGKYRLLRVIGQGGMGTVWEAEPINDPQEHCALKLLHQRLSESHDAVPRFLREGNALAALNHPNIVRLYELGKDLDGSLFMAMELLRGQTLAALLDEHGRLSPMRATRIALQVLSALGRAHAAGVVHRDLKPENIFVVATADGEELIKVLDFSVAKLLWCETPDKLSLTQTGAVIGTATYLSPEQARGHKNLDHRSDIWALGVLLYEMLAGQPPYVGNNYNEVIAGILQEPPPPLRPWCPHVPAALEQLVLVALQKAPQLRPQSAVEFLHRLLPFAGTKFDTTPPPSPPRALQRQGKRPLGGLPTINARELIDSPLTRRLPSATPLEISEPVSRPPRAFVHADDAPVRAGSTPLLWGAAALVCVGVVALSLIGLGLRSPGSSRDELTNLATLPAPMIQGVREGVTSQPPPLPPTRIKLRLSDLPPAAEVRVDGQLLRAPFSLPRATKPALLQISAPGFARAETLITPVSDLTLAVAMAPLEPAPASARPAHRLAPQKTEQDTGATADAHGKDWAQNPFPR